MTEATMKLPDEDFIPEIGGIPQDLTMIVFGPPKIGKTTFGASWPKSLLLECEPGGAKYVKCRKLDITNLAQLRDAWNLLKGDTTYETVVLDSLDRVAQWIEDEICQELGLTTIMEAKKGERHGAQWGLYVQRVLTLLEGWKMLGKRVIFLAHTRKAETDGQGIVISPKTINLYGQAAGRVIAIVENIGHMYAEETPEGNITRILSFRAGIHVESGSRHPMLTDKRVILSKDNPYGDFAAMFTQENKNGTKTEKDAKKELAKAR